MKKLHTRWIVLGALLALVLAVGLCACSGGQEPSQEVDTPVETATPTPTPTATPEPTATPTPTPTPTPEATVEPTPEVTPEPTDDNAELVALKNGEVNANDNLTSSANGKGNQGEVRSANDWITLPEPTVQPVTSEPDKGNDNNQQGNGSSDNGPREFTEEELRAMGLGGETECNVVLGDYETKEEAMKAAEDYWKALEEAGCR